MNLVVLMGRVTRDPEVKSSNNVTFANYSIAVDRRYKREGDPTADFFNCTVFGKAAEFVEKYVKKGTKLVVTGHLQNDTYTNKDGQKVTSTKVMVDSQEFAESKGGSGQTETPGASLGDGFNNASVSDDELPFD